VPTLHLTSDNESLQRQWENVGIRERGYPKAAYPKPRFGYLTRGFFLRSSSVCQLISQQSQ
jgi:hypothetical protein